MGDEVRINRMLRKLKKAWRANSDQRLGQLICNLQAQCGSGPLFYVEDAKMESALEHPWWK